MATVTRPAPVVKSSKPAARKPRTVKVPHGSAGLVLEIANGDGRVAYRVRRFAADPGAGVASLIRLTRLDGGAAYHVARHGDGTCSCDCPSQEFDHNDNAAAPHCKHIASALSWGLI